MVLGACTNTTVHMNSLKKLPWPCSWYAMHSYYMFYLVPTVRYQGPRGMCSDLTYSHVRALS